MIGEGVEQDAERRDIDETPECQRQIARCRPCEVNRAGALFWDDYINEPEREWDARNLPLVEKPLQVAYTSTAHAVRFDASQQ